MVYRRGRDADEIRVKTSYFLHKLELDKEDIVRAASELPAIYSYSRLIYFENKDETKHDYSVAKSLVLVLGDWSFTATRRVNDEKIEHYISVVNKLLADTVAYDDFIYRVLRRDPT